MSAPVRIQRKRTKGWTMPENTVYVGRPTIWGNPYRVGAVVAQPTNSYTPTADWQSAYFAPPLSSLPLDLETMDPYGRRYWRTWFVIDDAEKAVDLFRQLCNYEGYDFSRLRGKNLACWCPLDQPCHADVLLELANGGTT